MSISIPNIPRPGACLAGDKKRAEAKRSHAEGNHPSSQTNITIEIMAQTPPPPPRRREGPSISEKVDRLIEEVDCGGPENRKAYKMLVALFHQLKDNDKQLAKNLLKRMQPVIEKYAIHNDDLDITGEEYTRIFY